MDYLFSSWVKNQIKNKRMLSVIILLSFCLGTINASKCDSDFCIGALFDIKEPPASYEPTTKCKKIHEVFGIQRIEAALMAIDSINKNDKILPGITLGLNIADTCRIPSMALYQALNLIKDVRSLVMDGLTPELFGMTFAAAIFSRPNILPSTTIGIVGPATTDEITQVQNLLKLFNIPHIGYSDMEPDLGEKCQYSTFLRVLPCRNYQTHIIRDVLKQFSWSYFSAIYTSDNKDIMGVFREVIRDECNNINSAMCIANEIMIESYHDQELYNVAVNDFKKTEVNVIVCFCDNYVLRKIYQAMKESNSTDRFIVVTSDNWENRDDMTRGLEEQVQGSIFIRIESQNIPEFSNHYTSLKPSETSANLWFHKFWEDKFNCTLPDHLQNRKDKISSNTAKTDVDSSRKLCTGNESLATNYQEQKKIGYVMKAIWTMAHGLHNMIMEICGANYTGICTGLVPLNHLKLLYHLKNLSYDYDGEVVSIDENGYPSKKYEILNFQNLSNNTFAFVHIGDWKNERLEIFRNLQSKGNETVTSICALPCALGQYKLFTQDKNPNCCWICRNCGIHEYVLPNKTSCMKCPQGERPNKNRTGCDKIPYLQRDWTEPTSIMVVSFTASGLFLTLITCGVFVKYKNTPVVKSSNWELSIFILFSIILAHISAFIVMMTPTTLNCTIARILPGIAFTIMFASLCTKTRRIVRILAGSKKKFPRKQYKLMSASIQLAISLFYAAIEAAICFMMMIIHPPVPTTSYSSEGYPMYSCEPSSMDVLIPSALVMYLLVLCTVYAIKARNIPGNFNEAKFIGFAILISFIIWAAFYPIYFCSESKAVTFSMCVTLTASMMMFFLFFPKMYIIFFKPEQNKRALFITNKSIRTHIGTNTAGKKSHLNELPICIIPDEKFENSERSCKLRTVAVQTTSKLLRNLEICYDRHRISSIAQNYSSTDDDELISDDDDNHFYAQYNDVNVLNEIKNDESMNQQTNDLSKSKEKFSSTAVELLTSHLNSLQDKRETNFINNTCPVISKYCKKMNIMNLLQNDNTRGDLQFHNHDLGSNGSENVSKKVQQIKHTRIHEVQTPEFHNGNPIFNITISL